MIFQFGFTVEHHRQYETKRRSSTRGHIKKNCSCCVVGGDGADHQHKRTKSETSWTDDDALAALESESVPTVAASDRDDVRAAADEGVDALPATAAATKTKSAKKNAQRKR